MIPLAEIILGGLATLAATLIGVSVAFALDRRAERNRKRNRVVQHLNAVEKELRQNESTGWNAYSVIQNLKEGEEVDADHYALELFSTDAWDAAIQDQLIDVISAGLYHDLQQFYQEVKSTNEFIRRLRVEPLHPDIGELVDDGSMQFENWTYTVHYYDEDKGGVGHLGLGPLIQSRCKSLAEDARELQEDLEEKLSELNANEKDPSSDREVSKEADAPNRERETEVE